MPDPKLKTDFSCGDTVYILVDGKITKSRINAKNTLDRLVEGKTVTKLEFKIDGIEKHVEAGKDFFASQDDLVNYMKG